MQVLGKYEVPNDLLYSKEHEWIRKVPEGIMVGITDFAQSELGDIAFVDLPDEGAAFKQGDVILQLESVKSVTDVFCPVSGTVAKVNDALEDTPQLINESPHDKGWLVIIAPDDFDGEAGSLLSAEEYVAFAESTVQE